MDNVWCFLYIHFGSRLDTSKSCGFLWCAALSSIKFFCVVVLCNHYLVVIRAYMYVGLLAICVSYCVEYSECHVCYHFI